MEKYRWQPNGPHYGSLIVVEFHEKLCFFRKYKNYSVFYSVSCSLPPTLLSLVCITYLVPHYFLPFVCIFQKATGTSEEVFPDVTSGTDVTAALSSVTVPPMVGTQYCLPKVTQTTVFQVRKFVCKVKEFSFLDLMLRTCAAELWSGKL